MKVEKNTVVSVSYTLYKENEKGEVLEVCSPEKPLEFIFGFGELLPKFEENLVNLEVGDEFDFVLAPAEAYGERIDEAIVELSTDIFALNGIVMEDMLYVGNKVPMRDSNGQPMMGEIVKVDLPNKVLVMDFNHPLAGVELYFSGKIEAIREATEEEQANGLRRGCGGCGGNGGCSSEGSCGGCGDSEGGCCGGCH
ncbi:MAG: peptidylprolyl isomerase [Bacteroidales bacterium]|nr:peptidylprolyl isomerase [Bacteroidales bacterium]